MADDSMIGWRLSHTFIYLIMLASSFMRSEAGLDPQKLVEAVKDGVRQLEQLEERAIVQPSSGSEEGFDILGHHLDVSKYYAFSAIAMVILVALGAIIFVFARRRFFSKARRRSIDENIEVIVPLTSHERVTSIEMLQQESCCERACKRMGLVRSRRRKETKSVSKKLQPWEVKDF
mmetsp:Transcript_12717/g.15073  ORF Transcript_12717/g.15073 Transcript_12717/m.15073 type:complete len:176 (-) Transcript_12717:102-629(-)|eukprot:jgi/Bigna1/87075/estExt_fgenesh1_pg.C_160171